MTQLGEGIGLGIIGPLTDDKTKILRGEIVEFTWGGNIPASNAPSGGDRATVDTPHWVVGKDVSEGLGSRRPGVLLVNGAKGTDSATVKVRIRVNQNVSGDAKLVGFLGALEFEGSCPTAAGDHLVKVKIKKPPAVICHERGSVGWGLEVPDMRMSLPLKNATRLEAFVVLDTPGKLYGPEGVWVEALRFLCDTVRLVGLSEPADVVTAVAKYCHGRHGLRYDTEGGAPWYGVGGLGGTFELAGYLQSASPVVNCYDQAAAVQSLCGAVGVPVDWLFLQPFGFIKPTQLVGVGRCNNPFFESNGSSALVADDSPDRTDFGNHAFGDFSQKVIDACAGPHTGTESRKAYCDASIDSNPKLYRKSERPGSAADIVKAGGVTRVV